MFILTFNKYPNIVRFMGKRYHGGEDLIAQHINKGFPNDKEFAVFLNELEPRRSIDSWRIKVGRYRKANPYEQPKQEVIHTYYDEGKDQYLTFLSHIDNILVISGKDHRNMRRSYSNEGGGLTIDEMCAEYEMDSITMSAYIRAYNWKHTMNPLTDEEITLKDTSSLVQDYLSIKRQEVVLKAQKQLKKDLEADATAWREFKHTIYDDFQTLVPKIKSTAKKPKTKAAHEYALVLSPTDLHFGKYGWKDEVGEEYDMDIAKERLIASTEALLTRLPHLPEKIILTAGSDWFHVDNDNGTTTKGTPQDTDATPAEILMKGCSLARQHIDMLRKVAPVDVVLVAGNHDRHTSLMLMMYLEAAYEQCEDVSVVISPQSRQYVQYGDNLLGFTHGDKIRLNTLPAIMSNEQREAWGECRNHVWFHGHLHHLKIADTNGATVIQLPSLSGHDRYHARSGYVMERKGLCGHMIDKTLGVVGNFFIPVVKDE